MNNGKICVSVCAESAEDFIQRIQQAEEFADVIELRFDCLEPDDVRRVFLNLPSTTKTFLFTFRPKEQGGKREVTLGERLKFWELPFSGRSSDFMIDIECEPKLMLAVNPDGVERIVAYHYFDAAPADVAATWERMSDLSDGSVKIAVQADDIVDAIPVWKLIDRAKAKQKQIIPIAMGEAGKWTRILGLAHGASMTYASLDAGSETAPGQITAKDLNEVYRVKELDRDTAVYGVIGNPLANSKSVYIHNPAFVSADLNAVFIPLQVKNLDDFMRRMVLAATREVELNFAGFAVTMPHKQSIMNYLDAIDPVAEKIGAVNTVKIEGDKLTGYNTDAYGFITPLLEKYGDLRSSRVAVCGAGGAARSCIYALLEEGADVSVYARDEKKAGVLGEEFDVQYGSISNLKSEISNLRSENSDSLGKGFDILVDTTPMGMKGPLENESLFTADELSGVKFVYDLVTSSTETPVMREARKVGIPAIGGLEMLIAQGAKQFEIWTGKNAPVDVMRANIQKRMK